MVGFFFRINLLILFLSLTLFVEAYTEPKVEKLRGILHNTSKLTAVDEKILQEIEKAYKQKDFDKVVNLHQQIPPLASLSAEEFLILAESYYLTGQFDRAFDLAERASSLRRGTELACRANLLKVKVLYLRGKEKEAQRELKTLVNSFCAESFEKEIRALQYFLFREKIEPPDSKSLKSLAGEISQARFNHYLKVGKLREAESTIYDYINLSGDYIQAKTLFFKLAEAYLTKEEPQKAKKFYQLIVTEWDFTKEAFLSKFRLYQLTYEKTAVKELLPTKTLDDLLMYIVQIKAKYPEEPIAEEASYLGIRIFFDKRDWEKTRERAKEFLSTYPKSSYYSKALSYYCNATMSLVSPKFLRGEVRYLLDLSEKEVELLRESQCGIFYYMMGAEFFKYRLWRLSAHYFLQAHDLRLPENYLPDYYLKLSFLAEELGQRELAQNLFNYTEKNWGKNLRESPEYLYLLSKRVLKTNVESGFKLLAEVQKSPLPSILKEELYQQAFYSAIEKRKYSLAHDVLKIYLPKPSVEDYIVLLVETFAKEPKLFETILEEAKRRYPQNPQILWLEVSHLERKGDLKKTPEIWKKLSESKGLEGEVARQFRNFQEIIQRAQRLVY